MDAFCSNCQGELPENAKFCPHCGQTTGSHRQPLFPFLKQSVNELLDIDGRLLLTLKTLLTTPGLASYEYDKGMRAKYTPPLRLYLVVSVIFFLLFPSFHQVFRSEAAYSSSMIDGYSRAMFVLFPLFAVFVTALHRNSYLVSNLVFSLHLHTVAYLVLLLIGPLEALEERHTAIMLLQIPPSVYFLWYFTVAFKTMFRQSWPTTLAKASCIYFVYMAALGLMFDVILAT